MAASRQDVNRWIETAKNNGATHIISVCDTYDYDDYPVYVMPDETVQERRKNYDGKDMKRINEVIQIRDANGDISIIENLKWTSSKKH